MIKVDIFEKILSEEVFINNILNIFKGMGTISGLTNIYDTDKDYEPKSNRNYRKEHRN